MQVGLYPQNDQVKLVYRGHRVKVKVTEAKQRVCVSCLWVVCLRLKGSLVLLHLSVKRTHSLQLPEHSGAFV